MAYSPLGHRKGEETATRGRVMVSEGGLMDADSEHRRPDDEKRSSR